MKNPPVLVELGPCINSKMHKLKVSHFHLQEVDEFSESRVVRWARFRVEKMVWDWSAMGGGIVPVSSVTGSDPLRLVPVKPSDRHSLSVWIFDNCRFLYHN